jgi:hypothetical protein
MNRTAKRSYWAVVVTVLGLTFGLGCSPLTTLWFLRDDGKSPARYKLEPKDGKKEVTVAVLVAAAPEVSTKPQFASLDRDLVLAIGATLEEESAKEKVKLKVVEPAKLERLRSISPERYDIAERGEIAQKLGADYLIQVNVSQFSLYNSGFAKELPQGQAAMMIQVYEAGPDGKKKYDYPFDWQAPQRTTGDVPVSNYYQGFVKELGKRIAQHHVKHTADRENGTFGTGNRR